MKSIIKINIYIFFSALTLLMFMQSAKAYEQEWLKTYTCDEALGLTSFTKAASSGLIQSPYDDVAGFVNDTNLQKYCFDTNIGSVLVDYKVNNSANHSYCPMDSAGNKTVAGVDPSSPVDKDKYVSVSYFNTGIDGNAVCCTTEAKYYVGVTYLKNLPGNVCCKSKSLKDDELKCSDGTDVVPYTRPEEAELGSSVFPLGSQVYSCSSSNCFLDKNGNELDSSVKRTGISEAKKNEYGCWPSEEIIFDGSFDYSSNPSAIPGGKYCYNGQLVDGAVIKKWGKLMGLYDSCMAFPDVAEQNTCLRCYEPCANGNHTSCPLVYNSVGCIDTNPQGLITRVFQIGIGIIGAVGMLRVMQAAFMRQSGEPAKIKESYEIINSVIIGAVLLVFGVIILRFIGVNVLQILPSDFLQ